MGDREVPVVSRALFPRIQRWSLARKSQVLSVALAAVPLAWGQEPDSVEIDTMAVPSASADFVDDEVPREGISRPDPALERPSRLSEKVQNRARSERKSTKAATPSKRKRSRRGLAEPGVVDIPAGCFMMGSPDEFGSDNEHPRHEVCVSAFRMDRLPVLESEFEAATGTTPWTLCNGATCSHPDPDLPAWYVTWNEADSFCRAKDGRLPTEAEFEYAARAGDSGVFIWGDTLVHACEYANLADLNLLKILPGWSAFPCDDGHALIAPAGGRKPNRWGLHDMAGNVWQWTSDWYAADWYASSPRQDPTGPSEGTGRVMRGGSWLNGPTGGRAAYRDGFRPDERYSGAIGFRCVYAKK